MKRRIACDIGGDIEPRRDALQTIVGDRIARFVDGIPHHAVDMARAERHPHEIARGKIGSGYRLVIIGPAERQGQQHAHARNRRVVVFERVVERRQTGVANHHGLHFTRAMGYGSREARVPESRARMSNRGS